MPLREGELVEVVLDRLDLPVVPHLVAQPEERILDRAPDLRDQVQLSERPLLAGERDVEVDVLHDVGGELALALLQRLFDPRRAPRSAPSRSRGHVPRAAPA